MCEFACFLGVPGLVGLAGVVAGAPLVAWESDLRVFLAG